MRLPAYLAYRWLWQMVDWIYPPSCCGCSQSGSVICSSCCGTIQHIQGNLCPKCGYPRGTRRICAGCSNYLPQYTQMRSVADYTGCVKEAVHQLKYKNNLGLGIEFANWIYELILSQNWNFDVITPVPLSPKRKKDRGYNQASLITYPLSLKLDCKMDDKLIKRVKETQTQIVLNAQQRLLNLQNAFIANSNRSAGKNVLLVDDVITTGATINDCARALKSAGAKEVYAVSVGRVVLKP